MHTVTFFFELFEPGLKYLREEKDRQKILVAKPSHGGKRGWVSTSTREPPRSPSRRAPNPPTH